MVQRKKCCIRTSFFYDVLSSVSILQTKNGGGVKLCDLVKFMKTGHSLSGDIESQIESVLNNAQDNNFVLKKSDRFYSVSPAATVHLVPSICLKSEIDRIEGIFGVKKKRKRKQSGSRSRSRSPRRKVSKCISPMTTRSRSKSLNSCNKCPSVGAHSTPKKCMKSPNSSIFSKILPSIFSPAEKRSNCTNVSNPYSLTALKKCGQNKSVTFKKNAGAENPKCGTSLEALKKKILENKKNSIGDTGCSCSSGSSGSSSC